MNDLQKMGGVAALIAAAALVAGFGLFIAAVVIPTGYLVGKFDPGQAAAVIADNASIMYIASAHR